MLARLGDEHPPLAAALPSTLTVVRGAQAGGGDVLRDGDEVALLTPVAGG